MRRVAVVHSGLAGPVAGGGTRGAVVEVVGRGVRARLAREFVTGLAGYTEEFLVDAEA